MKALIEIDVLDDDLAVRVESFNQDVRDGNWDEGAEEATPQHYLREILSGMCEDEIPLAAFGLSLTARVVSVDGA